MTKEILPSAVTLSCSGALLSLLFTRVLFTLRGVDVHLPTVAVTRYTSSAPHACGAATSPDTAHTHGTPTSLDSTGSDTRTHHDTYSAFARVTLHSTPRALLTAHRSHREPYDTTILTEMVQL